MKNASMITGGWRTPLLAFLLLFAGNAVAQDSSYKDGGLLFTFGAGYEYMPDAYTSKGLAIDISARFYTSERIFWELNGHWGTHDGDKEVMQKTRPCTVHDERNCLLGAVGPGYEIFQTENSLFDVYVKALVGYGARKSDYDGYEVVSSVDDSGNHTEYSKVTLGCEDTHKGLAAVFGIGLDMRYKRWTLSPSVNAIYVGKKWDISPILSVGYFY